MKKNLLLFFLLLVNTIIYAQDQIIEGQGKVLEFKSPFDKITLEMKSKEYKNIPVLPVTSDTKFTDGKGTAISTDQIKAGSIINLKAEKSNYKWHITSIGIVPEDSKMEKSVKGTFSISETESQVFAKDITFSLGWGLGSSLGNNLPHNRSGISWAAIGDKKLPLQFIEEYGFVSAGAYLGFKGYKRKNEIAGISYSEKWNYIIIGARTAFHLVAFKKLNRWDPYLGLMLSYNFLNYDYESSAALSYAVAGKTTYKGNAKPTLYVGSRYYLLKNLAAYSELGYGVSYFTLGLTLNIR